MPDPDLVTFMSVGTQILRKDLMDQYIRSLGNHRTHYAFNGQAGLRMVNEHPIDIIITEFELSDFSAFQMIRKIRMTQERLIYYVLAVDEESPALHSIAEEMEVDAVLIQPFTAQDLKTYIDVFKQKRATERSIATFLHQAEVAFGRKDFPRADKLYDLCLKLEPENSRVQLRAGLNFLSKSDYKNAQVHLKRSLELSPKSAAALSALAVLEMKSKSYKNAHEHFLTAQQLSPLNPERPISAAKNRMDWSADDLKKAFLKHPGDIDLEFEYGRILVFQREYSQAVQVFQHLRLPQGDPRTKEAQFLLQLASKLGSINLG